jgi:ABC-type arginine/histidine transport system permease subunit
MGDLWSDLRLAMAILFFLFLVVWLSDMMGSKKIGFVVGIVVAYLTFFSHIEILIFVLLFFFGYGVFEQFSHAIWEAPENK